MPRTGQPLFEPTLVNAFEFDKASDTAMGVIKSSKDGAEPAVMRVPYWLPIALVA